MKHDSATAADKAVKDTPQGFSNRTGRDVAVRTQQKCVEVTAVAPVEDKTIADRLREMNREDACGCSSKIFRTIAGLGRIDDCLSRGCDQCFKDEARNLADMIEAEKAKQYADEICEAFQIKYDFAMDQFARERDCLCKRIEELEKTQSGVDVDALSELADHFERMGNDSLAWARVSASDLHRWKARIRDALKGAKPQLPEGVIWPTYEDGELVKPFDKLPGFDSGGVQKFIWTSSHNGAWQLQDAEGHMLNVMHGEPVKRPESEVLDADRVPIKVGDTVYHEVDGSELTVVGFRDEKEDGEVMVDVEGKWFCVRQFSVTHRKPDTQEAIDSDAGKWPCYYFKDRMPSHCGNCVLNDGDGECDSRCRTDMNLDLLRRQRKLLGGE